MKLEPQVHLTLVSPVGRSITIPEAGWAAGRRSGVKVNARVSMLAVSKQLPGDHSGALNATHDDVKGGQEPPG